MTRIFSLIILYFLTTSAYSQIKVKDNVKLNEINNSPVRAYDSISDFTREEKNIDYLKYIGQTLILPPLSDKNEKGVDIELLPAIELHTIKATEQTPDTAYVHENLKGIYNGYYDKRAEEIASQLEKNKIKTDLYKPYISLIIENPYTSSNFQLSREAFDKEYKIINITDTNNENLRNKTRELSRLRIWLSTAENDTIYFDKNLAFANKSLNPFFIKGFYEYHEKNYTGKTLFVFKESEEDYYGSPKDKYIDINTGESIILKAGDLWECEEIVYIKFGTVNYPYYIIRKEDKVIKVGLGKLFKSGFLSLEELDIMYNYWLREKQDIKESEELNKSVLMNDCLKKFDKSNCEKLINNEVEIGMTKDMIFYSFGEPFKSFIIKSESGIEEVLSYGSTILYFRNKKIFAIKQL
jgi:hypothetical protein